MAMPDFEEMERDVFGPPIGEDEEPKLIIEEIEQPVSEYFVPEFVPTTYKSVEDEKIPESAPPKTRRGRKPKSSVPINEDSEIKSVLSSRTDKELSQRFQAILIGATKIPAPINPHIEMTPQEAQSIADPVVSYAKSHVDSERVQQFVEHWDLLAASVATAAYAMRVVKETNDDRRGRVGGVSRVLRPTVVPDPTVHTSGPNEQNNNDGQAANVNGPVNLPPSEPYIGNL